MRLRKLPTSFVSLSRPRFRARYLHKIISLWPILIFVLLLYFFNSFFTVKQIDCTVDNHPCNQDIVAHLSKYIGRNLLLINQKQVTTNLENLFALNHTTLGFQLFNRLSVKGLSGDQPIEIGVIFVKDLPVLSMDLSPTSTLSSEWLKPSQELELITTTASASSYSIFSNGLMLPSSGQQTTITHIFSQKPDNNFIASLYSLLKLSTKYITAKAITILGDKVFLSQPGQPDIIVSVPFDEVRISQELRAMPYLLTLKKDAKVIDLRFKNPIIR